MACVIKASNLLQIKTSSDKKISYEKTKFVSFLTKTPMLLPLQSFSPQFCYLHGTFEEVAHFEKRPKLDRRYEMMSSIVFRGCLTNGSQALTNQKNYLPLKLMTLMKHQKKMNIQIMQYCQVNVFRK